MQVSRNCRAALAIALLALPSAALAQNQAQNQAPNQPIAPPRPQEAAKPPVISNTILAAALGGLVLFAGLFPAKRGHQD